VDEPKFDLALNAELQNGLVLLSHRRNARGILVSRSVRRPYVSLNRHWKRAVSCNLAQAMDTETNERRDFAICQ
jgi:hypothetical protein